MKLVLDVHHSAAVAEQLRAAGCDVVAAAGDDMLAGLSDEELLRAATDAGRAVVTEDLGDFGRLARDWGTSGQHHTGIVFTSRTRYYRGSASYRGRLISALQKLLDTAPGSTPDRVIWL